MQCNAKTRLLGDMGSLDMGEVVKIVNHALLKEKNIYRGQGGSTGFHK